MEKPKTEKQHKVILKTAEFFFKNEKTNPILIQKLEEKQKDNPTFSFLKIDDPLNDYFEILKNNLEEEESKKISPVFSKKTNNSLNMLSAYGDSDSVPPPSLPPKPQLQISEERKIFIDAFINLYLIGGDEYYEEVKKNSKQKSEYDFLYPWSNENEYYKKRLSEKKNLKK